MTGCCDAARREAVNTPQLLLSYNGMSNGFHSLFFFFFLFLNNMYFLSINSYIPCCGMPGGQFSFVYQVDMFPGNQELKLNG